MANDDTDHGDTLQPIVQPPSAQTPIPQNGIVGNQPVSSGRMYISPTPIPRLSDEQQMALQHQIASATATSWRPQVAPPPSLPQQGATEEAVSAAMRFQALRGYQNDLQAGKSSVEALTKWAPLMFANPKQGNLSGAASFIRAATPQSELRTAGGRVYRIGPQGATALTPATAATKIDPFDKADYDSTLKEMNALEKPKAGATPKQLQVARQRRDALQLRLDQIRSKYSGTVPATTVAAPAARTVQAPLAKGGKVERARALRRQHPDWSKVQIIEAVNAQ